MPISNMAENLSFFNMVIVAGTWYPTRLWIWNSGRSPGGSSPLFHPNDAISNNWRGSTTENAGHGVLKCRFESYIASKLSCGVIGNTSDSGSEEREFEPLQDNQKSSFLSFLAKNSD